MNTSELTSALSTLLDELVNGAPDRYGQVLNGGDVGLLRSLDRLSAEAASAVHAGGASVAAHADHVRYSLSLMNRWAAGEPGVFENSDWTESWRRTSVTEDEWKRLRAELAEEAERWLREVSKPREELRPVEFRAMLSTIAHLAYHFGAMRQIDREMRGPSAWSDS